MSFVFNPITGALDVVNDSNDLVLRSSTALSVGDVVVDIDGFAVKASVAEPENRSKVVGLVSKTVVAGKLVRVANNELLENNSWSFVPEAPVFLGLNGEVTQQPFLGTFVLQLGHAVTPTKIFVRVGISVLRA